MRAITAYRENLPARTSLLCRVVNRLFIAAAVALAVLPTHVVRAQGVKVSAIEAIEPFVRVTPGGVRVGSVYLKLHNRSDQPDRLIAVETTVAKHVEVHRIEIVEGVSKMRRIDGLLLPPGSTTELRSGGLHLMFAELRSPFREGDTVATTFVFERSGRLDVVFEVKPLGARCPEIERQQMEIARRRAPRP